MTRIKYATVARARESNTLMLLRGKKTGKVGYRPLEGDEGDLFQDPLYSERVVELPERMSPTEYREWVDNLDGDSDAEVVEAIRDVADEYGADAGVFSADSDDERERVTDGGPDHDVPVNEQLTARQRELVGRDGGDR